MSGLEKASPRRPLLAELNPHLMCILCGGYYVDAAAIIECLHTFCKSCLVRYLETNKYCPICDVQVHKTRPLQNIRPDTTLQDMVYKLVPGLYHKEMMIRREFYSKCPNAPASSLEDRGDLPPELSPFYAPDELVNLVLEYCPPDEEDEPTGNNKDLQNKRFLRCPAAVKITHLEKLLRNKYGLDYRYNVELMFDNSKLCPDLSLMEVAYAFGRKRKGQFLFTYRIYDSQCKKMRLSCDSPDEDMRPVSPLPSEAVKIESEKVPSVEPVLSSAETTSTTTTTSARVVPVVSVPVTSAPPVSVSVTPVSTPAPSIAAPQTSTVTPVTTSVTTTVTPMTTVATSSTSATPVTTSAPSVTTFATPTTISITPLTIPLVPVTIPTPPVSTSVTNVPAPPSTSAAVAPAVTTAAATSAVTPVSQPAASVTTVATAAVKSTVTPTASEKTTITPVHSPATTPTDGKSKLDSIISRLGDPSKHSRPEPNSATPPATTKQAGSARKTQGKEVQLRISENGVMKFTSMGLLDKLGKPPTPDTKIILPPPNPFPKPPTKVGHSVKVTEKSSNSESAPKPGAVAPVSPNVVASPRKPSSSPIGYKTLKSGPKSWNPTISRNSFLSAKLEQQQQLQKQAQQNKDSLSSGTGANPATTEPIAKPPRFFKARNTPRYLGNPASGVKPMYQIASSTPPAVQKAPPLKPSKPPAVLKIDPRTLTPIMAPTSAAVSAPPPPSPQPIQAKDRPPFLSTTISGASNHTPSSRCVTTTSSTVTESLQSNSSSKLSSDLAMRNSSTLAFHNHMRYLPFCDPLNPFAPRLPEAGVNRMPNPTPYTSMLRPPFGALLVNSYGQCRPPPVGLLYNQPLHRQLNHQGPLSPVPGLPSPLPPSPAPLSPSSAPKNVIPPAHWVPTSPSSPVHQSKVSLLPQPPSKSPTSKSLPSRVTDDQTKVNGEKPQVKDKSVKKTEEPTVQSGADKEEKGEKVEEARPPGLKETAKEEKSREQDNNNTVVVDKKSVTASESVKDQSKPQSQQLYHNISKLCSTSPAGKELPASGIENSSADQAAAITK